MNSVKPQDQPLLAGQDWDADVPPAISVRCGGSRGYPRSPKPQPRMTHAHTHVHIGTHLQTQTGTHGEAKAFTEAEAPPGSHAGRRACSQGGLGRAAALFSAARLWLGGRRRVPDGQMESRQWAVVSGCLRRVEAQAATGPQGPLSSANTRPSPDLLGWKLLTLGCWDQFLHSDLSEGRGASTGLRG